MIEIKPPTWRQSVADTGHRTSVFMAGGITGCPDWQKDIAKMLDHTQLVLYNPRREHFDVSNSNLTKEQIFWEFEHLKAANIVSFWFPPDTLCPITLYELGAHTQDYTKPLLVGVHPLYKRRIDIEEQTKHARPDIRIVYSLEDLAEQIARYDTHKHRS